MADRLDLQTELEEILGSRNVYHQPPASVKMQYEAIRYSLNGKAIKRANNKVYGYVNEYSGVVISRNPDTTTPDRLLTHFEMISFGKPYVSDNLYHFPFTIYY